MKKVAALCKSYTRGCNLRIGYGVPTASTVSAKKGLLARIGLLLSIISLSITILKTLSLLNKTIITTSILYYILYY